MEQELKKVFPQSTANAFLDISTGEEPEEKPRRGRRTGTRARVIPVEPPPEILEKVESAWSADEELQDMNLSVEWAEKEHIDALERVRLLNRKFETQIREQTKIARAFRLNAGRMRAKRNTLRNKIYKKIEDEYIRSLRAGLGIKQTWNDPMVKRSIQRADVNDGKPAVKLQDI